MTRNKFAPFKGQIKRPYDQEILKDVRWYDIDPVWLNVETLWLTQKHLNIEGVLGGRFSTDTYPRVVKWTDGELYLEDGHHRLVMRMAHLNKLNTHFCHVTVPHTVNVRVVEIDRWFK